MFYSSAGILALIIHLIINHDVMWYRKGKHTFPSRSAYRAFLYAVMVYYISDILWGILYENHLITLTFIDTALYFFAMASSILLWTRFVVGYLQETNFFGKILGYAGWIFFAFEMLVVVMNFIVPVLFSFDSQGNYHAESGRYITLGIQFLMFLFSAIYALVIAFKKKGIIKSRYRTNASCVFLFRNVHSGWGKVPH